MKSAAASSGSLLEQMTEKDVRGDQAESLVRKQASEGVTGSPVAATWESSGSA